MLKRAWFSYVGKIPDNRGFHFLPTVPDISDNHHNSLSDSPDELGRKWKVRQKLKLAWWGDWSPAIWGINNERNPSPTSPTIADHRRNLGRVGKIETLPILQICPRPSQTIGDIYDFEFSLVGKIWDSREAVKSPIVWDFPHIWKPGYNSQAATR